MLGLSLFQISMWAATTAMEASLLGLLIVRRQYREFPIFSTYILTVLLQSAILFFSYQRWGFDSTICVWIAWSSQLAVLVVRALVVMELCHRLLGPYRGIWALAWRILLIGAFGGFSYSLLVSRLSMGVALVNADRGVELTVAAVVVLLFLFASYYEIVPDMRIRSLAVGLCLFSCFHVLNDSFLERWMEQYSAVWNVLGSMSFNASLVLWFWGFRRQRSRETLHAVLLPKETYKSLSPQLNLQLRQLNDRLSLYWQIEEPRH